MSMPPLQAALRPEALKVHGRSFMDIPVMRPLAYHIMSMPPLQAAWRPEAL